MVVVDELVPPRDEAFRRMAELSDGDRVVVGWPSGSEYLVELEAPCFRDDQPEEEDYEIAIVILIEARRPGSADEVIGGMEIRSTNPPTLVRSPDGRREWRAGD